MKVQSKVQSRRAQQPSNPPVQPEGNMVRTRLYHFPDINQLGKQFDNVQQINQKLDILLKNHNLTNSMNKIQKSLVIRETEGGYLFKCKAKGCYAFLKFHYTSNGRLMLAKSDIEHEHKLLNQRLKRTTMSRSHEIEQCMDQLQLMDFRPMEISNFIKIRFNIPSQHFNYVKVHRNRRETIKSMIMALEKYDRELYLECKDLQELAAFYRNEKLKPEKKQDKDVVIIVTRKMKDMYQRYHGEYVLLSIFPQLVLETRFTRKLKYHHVAVLYGEDATGSVTQLFGIIFMRKSIRLAYLYILEKLFYFLRKYPKVLVTDYDPHLSQAVRRLQKRAGDSENTIKLHLQLPNSFITNNFQARTSPQFLSILSSDLQGLLREADRSKHEQRLKVIMQACALNPPATQDRIAQQILKYVKGNSIIYLPPLFIGLSVTPYSATTYLRARVLDFFKSPRPMLLAVKAFFEIFKIYPVLKYLKPDQIEARLNPPKESSLKREKLQLLALTAKAYESTTRLKTVTKALSQSAALCFYDSLEKCFLGRVEFNKQSSHHSYRVVQSPDTFPYVINRVYQTHYNNKVKVWRCNCHYFAKTGLPCWHEIKVCLEQRTNMIPQVSLFWLKNSSIVPQGNPNANTEHDVKYWNEDGPKVSEEREKLEYTKSGQARHSQRGNIKINGNENELGNEEMGMNVKESEGLCDLINELHGIEWKDNDELDSAFTLRDNLSLKSANKEQDNFFNEEEDLTFNNPPIKHPGRPRTNFSQTPNLRSLKANNHSSSRERSERSSSRNQPVQDFKFFEDDNQMENQWPEHEDLKFGNYQSDDFYQDDEKEEEEWCEGMGEEGEDFMNEQMQEENEQLIPDRDSDRFEENSQQNSEEQWQRKSLDQHSKAPSSAKKQQPDAIDFNIDDLNFDFDDQQALKMDYQQLDSND